MDKLEILYYKWLAKLEKLELEEKEYGTYIPYIDGQRESLEGCMSDLSDLIYKGTKNEINN